MSTPNLPKRWIIKAAFVFSIVLLLCLCVFLLKRTVPFEIQTLLDSDNPARIQYEEDLKSFNDEASVWLALQQEEPFTALQIFNLSKEVAAYFETESAFTSVQSPHNAKYFTVEKDGFRLVPFLENGEWTSHALEKLNTELWKDSLLREDHKAFLMNFEFRRDLNRREEKPAVDRLENFLKQMRVDHPGVTTGLIGAKIASASFLGEMAFQQRVITPLLILSLGLFLWLCYRSWQIVAWNFFVMFVCYVATLCLIILVEGGLGPYSSFALMFAFIVATTDLIHFFARFQQLEGSVEERIKETVRIAYVPCLLTSLTTSAGFVALILNQNLPIRYFGLYCAFSCMLEWAIIFWILPTLLRTFRFDPGNHSWSLYGTSRKIGPWIERHAGSISVISVLVILISIGASFLVRVDDNFYTKFASSHPLSRSIDLFSKQFNFVGSIDVIIRGRDRHLPGFNKDIRSLESELVNHPVVSRISSYRQIEDELDSSIRQASLSNEISVRTSITNLLQDYGVFNSFLNESRDELRTIVFLKSMASSDLDSVLQKIEALRGEYRDRLEIRAAGFSVIRSFINSRVIRDFLESFALSFLLIFRCYLWLYRSFKWSLIALIPNALPLFAISGLMGIASVPADTNLVILICVVFGIAGDNTIHLTYVLRKEREKGFPYDQALERAWRLIGIAMIGTCGAFLFCLPVFLLGTLKLFNQIAIFLSVAFLAAFFADTVLFPAIQIRMGWGEEKL